MDLFSSPVVLRYKKNKEFTTGMGKLLTIVVSAIVLVRLIFISYWVYLRKSPSVISTERYVSSPEAFNFTRKSLQFAFGLQNPFNFEHYIDESIYSVMVLQFEMHKVLDKETGKLNDVWNVTYVKSGPCSERNFQNDETKDSFVLLKYGNLYCVDADTILTIEGDYAASVFKYFTIQVIPCRGDKCASQEKIDSLLNTAYFGIYYSDILFDPINKNNPFKYIQRNSFWTAGTQTPKDVSFNFRNNYVESDYGWILSDIETVRHAQSSKSDISMVVRFEKEKENFNQRNYKNFNDILSEIGGFTQCIIAFGFVLSSKISKFSFENELVRQVFELQEPTTLTTFVPPNTYQSIPKNTPTTQPFSNKKNSENNDQNLILNNDKQSQCHQELSHSSSSSSSPPPFPNNRVFLDPGYTPLTTNSYSQTPCNVSSICFRESPGIKCLNNSPSKEGKIDQTERRSSKQKTFLLKMMLEDTKENDVVIEFQNGNEENHQQQKQVRSHCNSVSSSKSSQLLKSQVESSSRIRSKSSSSSSSNSSTMNFFKKITTRSNSKSLLNCSLVSQIITGKQHQQQSSLITNSVVPEDNKKKSSKQKKIKKQSIQQNSNPEGFDVKQTSFFKKIMNQLTNRQEISTFDYFKSILWPWGNTQKKMDLHKQGVNQLYKHLDILNIIQKLIDIDKLKAILLADDQIKLFECFSKPKIDAKHMQRRGTYIQSVQNAYRAYKNISQRSEQSNIDLKVLNSIDPNLQELFNSIQEDEDNWQKDQQNENIQKNLDNKEQFDLQVKGDKSKAALDYIEAVKKRMNNKEQLKKYFTSKRVMSSNPQIVLSENEGGVQISTPDNQETNTGDIYSPSDIYIPHEQENLQNQPLKFINFKENNKMKDSKNDE